MPPFPDKMPRWIAQYLACELLTALPPPRDDRPETREARDVVAMAMIARLGPNNTAEAALAVQAVATQVQATDCLRAAIEFRDDFKKAMQCRAQSALMMRQSAQALKELRTLQATQEILLAQREREEEAKARQEAASAEAAVQPAPESAPEPAETSQETGQSPTRQSHEIHPRIPATIPGIRPSDVKLIAALMSGVAPPARTQPDLTG